VRSLTSDIEVALLKPIIWSLL